MFCANCGASNSDDAEFCSSCGKPLSGAADASPPQLSLASRGARLVAKIIDSSVWFVAITVIVIFFAVSSTLGALSLLLLLVIPIVQLVPLSQDGQTIGKKAVDIRIVMVSSGRNGGFVPNVLLRSWLNFFIGIIPFYGLVDILFIFREDQRCIHDLIASTRVVRSSSPGSV